jgi:hypothetical protein
MTEHSVDQSQLSAPDIIPALPLKLFGHSSSSGVTRSIEIAAPLCFSRDSFRAHKTTLKEAM